MDNACNKIVLSCYSEVTSYQNLLTDQNNKQLGMQMVGENTLAFVKV